MSTELTPKQMRFVQEYLIDSNGKQAAIRAGYSPKTAEAQASRLLSNAKVKAVVSSRTKKLMSKLDVTVERILTERARMAFYDPGDIAGQRITKPQDIAALPEDVRRAVAGWGYDKKGKFTLRLADKNASLTALEKHLNMYRDDAGDGSPLHIHLHLGD
ncbi:terminase small subunit [Trinickia soli]|nr:terminase small subunit [Trinickia soli]CAB3644131.1 hypothetical protein LMG24076_00461 [Trinickia soli]